ncbi:hypothetical protein [Novipirellula caenicola]
MSKHSRGRFCELRMQRHDNVAAIMRNNAAESDRKRTSSRRFR